MKYRYLILLICLSSCLQQNKSDPAASATKGAAANTIIPKTRDSINKKPVASYFVPMGDPRLDRKFGVNVYETKHTFKYLLEMQYDGMIQTDTLILPDFDTWPVVKIEPGKEKLSCIIGFMDKKNNFREYKLLSAKNNKLSLTVLQGYVVSEY